MFIGRSAGYTNADQSYNTYLGFETGYNNVGSQNTFLGSQAGHSMTNGSNNVFVGFKAGYNEAGSNKLYISNSDTITPLIYGEFDNGKVTINDVLKLAPRSSAPSPAEEGMMYYDNTSKQILYYNGTSWLPL